MLDNDELRATRKLHGQDDGMYRETSDKNVGSIEEAIEILKNTIRCNEKQSEELGTHILLQDDGEEAINIVLGNLEALCDMQRSADRELKNARKRNEEHQKINGELREKVKELKEYISVAPNLDKMTATKYAEIQREAYIRGRADEQQRAEQIIYESYIPKQKIKDKIDEIIEDKDSKYYYEFLEFRDIQKTIDILSELLQEEDK